MKTSFGKILVIATFLASVIFAMASLNLYLGGFNWRQAADEVDGYSILPVTGAEGHRYQSTDMSTNDPVGQPSTLPSVLVSTLKDARAKLDSENRELKEGAQGIDFYTKETARYKKLIETDEKGLEAKAEVLQAEINETLQETDRLSQQVINLTTEANEKLEDAQKRREDIARHNSQLDEIQTEIYRLEVQKKKLVDLLTRYEEIERALKRRQEQLTEQVDTVADANR